MTPALGNQPQRLWSLWDLMNLFNVKFCAKRVGDLARIESEFNHADPSTVGADLAASLENLKKTLRRTIAALDGLQMERCQRQLQDILKEAQTKPLLARQLAIHARNAAKAITEELHHRKFLYVEPRFDGYLDQDRLFGDDVWQKFRNARPDIGQAGNCLAADCGTAAVFHLMRAVEWGMRAFCVHLGHKTLRCKKKNGVVIYKPLEYATWDSVLNQLSADVQTKLDKLKRNERRQSEAEFYLPLLQDIGAFKDAFRNHVMHARREYTVLEAHATFERVKRFMTVLATRLPEA